MVPERRARHVALLSGGLDSAANLSFAVTPEREPDGSYPDGCPVLLAITVDYGQRAAKKEIEAARRIANHYGVRHEVVELPWLGRLGGNALTGSLEPPRPRQEDLDRPELARETARAVWVPNRNGVLIAVAASYADSLGASSILVGFNREEAATFPDNSAEFTERASEALRFSTEVRARVACFTLDLDKRQIVKKLRVEDARFPIDLIWSCYLGGERACGTCESCRRFERAICI